MTPYPTGVSYRGINRAGAEYGDEWDGWTGQTYYTLAAPTDLATELEFYANSGFNMLRLPISWERLQHDLYGDLDPTYSNQVMALVDQAAARGFGVIIDLHNYNRYATGAFDLDGNQLDSYTQCNMGDGELDATHLADVWTKLANLCLARTDVVFNLMNEPHDFPIISDDWFAMLQTVIDAIRTTGASQLILVPNSRGSDVDHWNTYAPNGGSLDSIAALSISDSGDNFAFDMHAYLDNPPTATSYVDLVTPVTQWAKDNGSLLFLSELGVTNGAPNGAVALDNLLSYLDANSDVWLGWTPWNLSPYNLTDPNNFAASGPQMPWYASHLTPNII
jgi:endoglucanase